MGTRRHLSRWHRREGAIVIESLLFFAVVFVLFWEGERKVFPKWRDKIYALQKERISYDGKR